MNETRELGNLVPNVRTLVGRGKEIILTGQIASASQEIIEGGTN